MEDKGQSAVPIAELIQRDIVENTARAENIESQLRIMRDNLLGSKPSPENSPINRNGITSGPSLPPEPTFVNMTRSGMMQIEERLCRIFDLVVELRLFI